MLILDVSASLFGQRKAKTRRNTFNTQQMNTCWTCLWIKWVVTNYYRSKFVQSTSYFQKFKISTILALLRRASGWSSERSANLKFWNVRLHTCTLHLLSGIWHVRHASIPDSLFLSVKLFPSSSHFPFHLLISYSQSLSILPPTKYFP